MTDDVRTCPGCGRQIIVENGRWTNHTDPATWGRREGMRPCTLQGQAVDGLTSPSEREANERWATKYEQGRRRGVKACVEWLHAHAETMNDPWAKTILNTAALGLGVDMKRREPPATTPERNDD